MKHMKKALSVLLTLVAVFALSTSAFAADNYTITINNTNPGHTYEAYQIFSGRLEEGVLSDIQWGPGVNQTGLIAALKNLTAFASLSNDATAADVAEILSGSAKDSDIAKDFASVIGAHLSNTVAGTSQENKDGEGKTVNYTISGLKAGYYLVKDQKDTQNGGNDTYTRYILNVVQNVTVTHKGTVPTVDKKITDLGEAADFNIGDNVPFTLTATLPNNVTDYETYKIVFHDTLSAGLTLNRDTIAVTINGKTVTNDFNINANGTSLTISCDDVLTLGATNGSKIVVTYTAKLNENAEIGQPGNPNKVKLEYSNDPNWNGNGDGPTGETPEDKVLVFTYELDVTKVDGQDSTKLSGAEFKLQNGAGKWVTVDANGKVTGWVDTEEAGSTLTSGSDGLFKVIGLDAGTYTLKETKAPAGYNMLPAPITIVISANVDNSEDSPALNTLTIKVDNGEVKNGDLESGIVSTNVQNNKGATLPETGGIGTTIFYVAGSILVLGAAVLLITKKRMSVEQ